ncbi:hypothetical protein GCM10010381_23030 [Streptomyces xantholiticus]|nr:hypothetical protein GCM10010381_23030 [Streptomyces xantholiticus]
MANPSCPKPGKPRPPYTRAAYRPSRGVVHLPCGRAAVYARVLAAWGEEVPLTGPELTPRGEPALRRKRNPAPLGPSPYA